MANRPYTAMPQVSHSNAVDHCTIQAKRGGHRDWTHILRPSLLIAAGPSCRKPH